MGVLERRGGWGVGVLGGGGGGESVPQPVILNPGKDDILIFFTEIWQGIPP